MTMQLVESLGLNRTLDQVPETGVSWRNPDVPLEPNEGPSGWSLPFTWILLVGFSVVVGLFWRSRG